MRASALLVLTLVLLGCDVRPAEEPPPAPPPDPPADALEAALRARGEEVADWMMRDGAPLRGTVAEGESRDFSHVMLPGFCYKVVAVSGEGIEDLEIRLYDGNSVLLQRDTTEDPQPFLGRERPVCPPETATYRLEVRAVAGGGDFAVHFYRSL